MKINHNRLIGGAITLTIAGLVSKLLSALYRIPLQNLTGDIGFYLYQQVYPMIAMVMIFSLYGFPAAVSKLTAEKLHSADKITYRNHFVPIFTILFICNSALALLIFLMAPFLASWMQDVYLQTPFKLGALLFLFIPFLALFRGVMQAYDVMTPTAYSQMVEQTVRVAIIIVGAIFISKQLLPVVAVASIGIVASISGMVIAALYLTIIFMRRFPVRELFARAPLPQTIPWKYYWRTLLIFGLLVTVNNLTFIMMQLVDVFTVVPQLIKNGFTLTEAQELKGVFDRGIPLVQFGVVFGSSFALAFIPAISKVRLLGQIERIQEAFALNIYVTFGAMIGLIFVLPEVNLLLFLDTSGTGALQILATVIVLLSISIIGITILQTQGYMKRTIISLIISFAMKWFLNILLIPVWGIKGSSLATVISLAFLSCVIMYELRQKLMKQGNHLFAHLHVGKLLLANGAMVVYVVVMRILLSPQLFTRWELTLYVIAVVSSGAFIYFFILIRSRALSEKQINAMPFSRILLSLLPVDKGKDGHK